MAYYAPSLNLIPSKLWTIPYDSVYVEMKDIWPSERGTPHDCFLPCMIIVSFHTCGLRWSICFLQSRRGSQARADGWTKTNVAPKNIHTLAVFACLIIRIFQLIFSAGTVFFSHNKTAGTILRLVFSAKRTEPLFFIVVGDKYTLPCPHCSILSIRISSFALPLADPSHVRCPCSISSRTRLHIN